MSDTPPIEAPLPEEPTPRILKGIPLSGSQAEKLVKVRREMARVDEMTRFEQIELEARNSADSILAQAQAKADELLAAAKREADNIRQTARQQGDAAAKKEALEKLGGLITSLENEITRLKASRTDFLKENLEGIIDFAVMLAGRIIVSELRLRPEAIAERACALLDRMPPGVQVTLCTCPDDLDTIERFLRDGGGPANRIMPSLRSDPTIPQGSLRLESDAGVIDAGLMETLEKLGKLLTDQARDHTGLNRQNGGQGNGF